MIKIEITDPHLLPNETLTATGLYFLRMAGQSPENLTEPALKVIAPHVEVTGSIRVPGLKPIPMPEISLVNKGDTDLDYAESEGVAPADLQENDKPISAMQAREEAVIPSDFNPFAKEMAITNTNVELDSQGLPWDKRIHARTKTKIANGEWKIARGTSEKLIQEVEAELRSVMALPRAGVDLAAPETHAMHSHIPAAQIPPPPPAPSVETFMTLVAKVTAATTAGKISHSQVIEAAKSLGLPSLPIVATRPDLVPQLGLIIDALIEAAG